MQLKNSYSQAQNVIFFLSKKIHEVLQTLIPRGAPCALLDFPNYSNPGDSAIWLGQTKWLRQNNNSIVYACDKQSYSSKLLSELIGNGIILLQGGGNFGDLWGAHQNFRERVISDFPHNKIIQLPQTIYFKERKALEISCHILNAHANLTFLCRDMQSLNIAKKEFSANSILCPDMAFNLGSLSRPSLPQAEILWLSRKDKESSKELAPFDVQGIVETDWLDEPKMDLVTEIKDLHEKITTGVGSPLMILSALLEAYEAIAEKRLFRGCRVLSKGKMVITDRLHAHILSLLLNIPHVLLDNNYGKVRGLYETWTQGNPSTKWANSIHDIPNAVTSDPLFLASVAETGIELSLLENLEDNIKKAMVAKEIERKKWSQNVASLNSNLSSIVSNGKKFILVDDDQIRSELGSSFPYAIPFIPNKDQYGGPATDDDHAMQELEQLRHAGACYIAFVWTAFWWLKYYDKFHNYIRTNFRCVIQNDTLILFDLRKQLYEGLAN
jgi:exopolysaccharide biosynthesis predicted pyruvyltransferase EpsI